ncbi:MAG: DAK2 domain-containing protein, partial [Lactobacillaceae bacterium]|nr:DAK2 domain-containing protein [Lactobacillaceae bacterium]
FAQALDEGRQMAYKAVMKPTEGTILTVIRESSEAALETAKNSNDVIEVAKAAYEASKKALASTPDLLPVLKEVGVVDSGGQGLVFVLKAFYEVLSGDMSPEDIVIDENSDFNEIKGEFDAQVSLDPADIVYGYCTTILLEAGKGTTFTKPFDYDEFYERLGKLGDSLLVLQDDNMVKTHVHVEDPGAVLSIATEYGSIASVKIDNMRDQQQEVIDRVEREKAQRAKQAVKTAVIAVAGGQGLVDLLVSMGVTDVISGGQTMNPSTQDIVQAIEKTGAKNAIILPNNSNIFMSANQAADLVDIPVKVVQTRTIQQGITAMLGFNPDGELEDNFEAMNEEIKNVKSLEITQAVRNTTLDGREISDGDWMGIADGNIVANGKKPQEVLIEALGEMIDSDDEIVTIFYGDNVSEKEAKSAEALINSKFDGIETELHFGGQKLYPLLISVE